eukprot:jgi/Chrzof1/11735/Cz06g07150.t1
MLPEATLQNGSASGTSSSNGYLPDARAETCTASEILAALSASADGDVKTLRRARRRFMSSKMQLVSASWVLDSLAALEQEGDHARRKTELAYTPAAAAAGQAPVKQEQEAQATAGVSAGDGVGDVGGASAAAAAAAADDDDITTTSRVKRRRKLPAIHTSTPSTGSKGDGTVLPAHVKDGDMPEPAKMSSAPADGGLDIARWPWYEVGVMAADGGSSDTSAGTSIISKATPKSSHEAASSIKRKTAIRRSRATSKQQQADTAEAPCSAEATQGGIQRKRRSRNVDTLATIEQQPSTSTRGRARGGSRGRGARGGRGSRGRGRGRGRGGGAKQAAPSSSDEDADERSVAETSASEDVDANDQEDMGDAGYDVDDRGVATADARATKKATGRPVRQSAQAATKRLRKLADAGDVDVHHEASDAAAKGVEDTAAEFVVGTDERKLHKRTGAGGVPAVVFQPPTRRRAATRIAPPPPSAAPPATPAAEQEAGIDVEDVMPVVTSATAHKMPRRSHRQAVIDDNEDGEDDGKRAVQVDQDHHHHQQQQQQPGNSSVTTSTLPMSVSAGRRTITPSLPYVAFTSLQHVEAEVQQLREESMQNVAAANAATTEFEHYLQQQKQQLHQLQQPVQKAAAGKKRKGGMFSALLDDIFAADDVESATGRHVGGAAAAAAAGKDAGVIAAAPKLEMPNAEAATAPVSSSAGDGTAATGSSSKRLLPMNMTSISGSRPAAAAVSKDPIEASSRAMANSVSSTAAAGCVLPAAAPAAATSAAADIRLPAKAWPGPLTEPPVAQGPTSGAAGATGSGAEPTQPPVRKARLTDRVNALLGSRTTGS